MWRGLPVSSLLSLLFMGHSRNSNVDLNDLSPVLQCRMTDPVLAADGQHYERSAIQAWLADHDTSPLTGLPLEHKFLIPNHMLRRALAARSGTRL